MFRTGLSALAASALALGVGVGAAQAQSRVFVAAQGSDANPCTFALPCRTFQHAHDVVAANGEIDVLDPAGYGKLTIAKAISIQGHGFAGISIGAGTGITINAPATASVHLDGLIIDGTGVGVTGIFFQAGSALVVENCLLRNTTNTGIAMNTFGTSISTLSVSGSYVASIGSVGISIQPSGPAGATAAIERTAFYDNSTALKASAVSSTGPVNVTVTDSIAADGGTGFNIVSTATRPAANLALMRTTIAGNSGTGVVAASPNTTIQLSQATIMANAIGYDVGSGGTIFSYGDNTIANNGSNTGTLTGATKQ
jgi:hypothetical protein